MATADDELPRGIARFWGEDGRVTGCGFLIAERTLCTCAHVVADALGLDEAEPAPPAAPVTIDFPLLTPSSAQVRATVTHWRAVTEDGSGDIALLSLAEPVPGTAPVRFAGGTAVWDHPFRVLGFPLRTDDHGVWVCGRLRAPVGKGWTSMEAQETPHGPAIGQGFSGAPVWDTEQGGVVGMTVAADVGSGARTAYLIPTALLLGLEPGLRRCPFRGLEPFREQDAALFFARRDDSARIAEAVRAHAFVPVAGASGVGKSSLVRAGVLPLLRAAGLTVTDFVGQPETDPVRTLAEALAGQFPRTQRLAGQLDAATAATRGRETAVLLGARLLDEAGPRGHVILLDQFEETVGARPADARALLDVLLPMTRAVHPDGRRLHILATLRSASLEELVADGRAAALSGTVQMVAPMTPAQLDQVVRRPVDTVPGVEFEPGLAELIVSDAGGEPGALPLVEFALAELWERQTHGRLTHAAYREIGRVEGALSRYADQQLAQVCKAPGGPDETVARRLFERLARPVKGKEYARVARAFDHLPPELRTAAQALAATRLLVIARDSSGRETVALAHEALLRQWPTLRGWLDESRDFIVWLERLRGRMREWEEGGRDPDLLLRQQELAAARTWAVQRPDEVSAEEAEFVRLSRLQRRRSVRRGRTGVALVACLTVLAVGLSFGLYKLIDEDGRRDKDEAARILAGHAEASAERNPVDAALFALSAGRTTSSSAEARAALTRQGFELSSLSSAHRIFPSGRVLQLAASTDGRRMVVRHEGTEVGHQVYVVSDLLGNAPRSVRLPDPPDAADEVAVSDDGRKAAAASADGTLRIWDLTGPLDTDRIPTQRWQWDSPPDAEDSLTLDFSPDGGRLLHAVEHASGDPLCGPDDLRERLRVVSLSGVKVKGRGHQPPDGLLKPDECLGEAALRNRGTGEVTVTVYSDDAEAVRANPNERLGEGLYSATLGTGGRSLGMLTKDDTFWQAQLSTSSDRKIKGKWPADYSFDTDCAGRFLVQEGRLDERLRLERSVLETGPVQLQDLVTGNRSYLVLPKVMSTDALCVVKEAGEVVVFSAFGRDLLRFAALPTPLPAWDTDQADVRDSDHVSVPGVTAQLRQVGDDGEQYVLHAVVYDDAKETRHGTVPMKPSREFSESVVLSQDGSLLLIWREDAWELLNTTDVTHRDADASTTGHRFVIQDVQRYRERDFLLLQESGLSVLHGHSGNVTPLPHVDCPPGSTPNPRACVLAVGRPENDDEVFVLRAGGQAEVWRRGQSDPEWDTDFGVVVEAPGHPEAVFRSDGVAVAVSTTRGVELWTPGHGEPRLLTGDAGFVGLYDRSGRLVVVPSDSGGGKPELWDEEDGSAPLMTLNTQSHVWSLTGNRLRGFTDTGFLDYDLRPLANGSPTYLCGRLGPQPPDVREALRQSSLNAPEDADMDPPC
ncbi:nSTAND1 domain-containing NTPase [Streptomyces bicolor]|uniref:nSTAND1 domain-containing NTPase n=1 Tax=Streptomyces bicolor TaxID=66874 RepID=UPI0004E21C6A|nr:trypsin-like peptidase domain-containing protein [Streptomyces bicolor]